MQTVADPSPLALEAKALDRVAAAKADDPLAPVLVVVPSRRLAEHVSRRLVERMGAVLGVEILHHAALAGRILQAAGVAPPRPLGDALVDRLAASVVRGAGPGRLRDFALEHPSAIDALRGSWNDLREAGVAPAAATGVLGREHAELAALYAAWSSRLDGLAAAGCADHAALAAAAVAHAPAFAAGFRAILHHGAYELIGVHDDLVRALDRGREVAFLLPARRADETAPLAVAASFLHAQGASAELETAARGALAAVGDGMPPHEVAVIVRSFGPYAAAMDRLLDADATPWHTSYARPLRRAPAVGRAMEALSAPTNGGTASFAAHAKAFEAIARDVLGAEGSETPAGRMLVGLIASLGEIETILRETRAVPREEALAWLDARVDAARLPPDGADGGGIRILDAMQARGLTFRHVALAGMNAGVFPRLGSEDPFLPDAARERIAAATGRPLRPSSAREEEEHVILSMVLGSARERLAVSWRRADEAGRPVVPSLALRDVARATGAGTGAGDVEKRSTALPAHPRSRLQAWAASPGLLRRDEEAVSVALDSETGADAGEAVARRLPALARGAALVEATDSFAPGAGAYDGRVGGGLLRPVLAATALERLGACPLRFFFGDVLHVTAPPEPPTEFEADFAAVGTRVHLVLRDVYAALVKEGAFGSLALGPRVARAMELLRTAWPASARPEDVERATRWPMLDGIAGQRWLATLDAFVAADLARLDETGAVPTLFEEAVEKAIPGGPPDLVVKARFDRIVGEGNARVIGDYKTKGDLKARRSPSAILSGAQLQVPIYALLAGAPVELLGVGPDHVPGPGDDDSRFVTFDGFKNADHRAGVLETIAILVDRARAGRFPLRSGEHCEHCDYAPACRRSHPPTEFREEHADDIADLRDCWEKNDREPTLAGVRAGRRP